MIVDFDTSIRTLPTPRQQRGNVQFAALMAQACPLFSPWVAAEPVTRFNGLNAGASLSTHAASSNRREGRHARE